MTRSLIAMSLLLLAPACADSASVDLPRIGTVGATPAELGLDHVVVTVTADGRIFTPDGETDPAELAAWLTPQADFARDGRYEQLPSHVHLVIRGDGSAPWAAIGAVLRGAADPRVRMNRVLFAVRPAHPADDREGAFAWFLPLDSGLDDDPKPAGTTALINVKPGDSLRGVLWLADLLHRAGHRPWVVADGGAILRILGDDGDTRPASEESLGVPTTPPPRSSVLAGCTVLAGMVEPILGD